MKKLIFASLLLVAIQVKSQTFEGTVTWSMKIEVTDPTMKAQLELVQKQMADPAMQAKIKQAMEQLNDPNMKAMIDANPQLKAQMENAVKSMQGGSQQSIMSSSLSVKVKDGNTLSVVEGGAMPMEILFLKNQKKTFMLDRKNKTYSTVAGEGQSASVDSNKPAVKVTKTTEKATILNYRCTKYIATVTDQGQKVDQIFWTTTDIKDFDLKSLSRQRVGQGQSIFYDGVEGVPLKIEIVMPQGKMEMEATSVKREPLSASDFVLPPDFKETQGMFGGRN